MTVFVTKLYFFGGGESLLQSFFVRKLSGTMLQGIYLPNRTQMVDGKRPILREIFRVKDAPLQKRRLAIDIRSYSASLILYCL